VQEKWDKVISLLEPSPSELKSSILLAQAYLGKSDLLKRQGDKAYSSLVLLPFNTGEELINHHNQQVQSEGFYIVAYSLFINDRKARAQKHLKKALELQSFCTPEVRYLLLDGRIKAAQGFEKHDDLKIISARKVFEQIIDMDVENEYKALSCFWLGELYSRWFDKKKAISSYNAALNYAEYESTRMRIQKQLASIQ
jgi:tetratricopeptide (TPR) repeat protein